MPAPVEVARPGAGSPSGSPVRTPRLCVGCSGWNYKSWRGPFYPPTLPASAWLQHYAAHFRAVEINNSFYRLPEGSRFASWRAAVPNGFVFAVKASRFLTHMKRLHDPEEPIARLFERVTALGPTLGPVLYQLPGSMPQDLLRLETFLRALPPRVQHVLEFRHPSWYAPEVYALLERHGAALCLHDKEGSVIDGPPVGPFMYVRFHGTTGRYHGSYADETLADWARRLVEAWRGGRDVYAYFNNDPDAEAVRNAAALQREVLRLTGADGPVHLKPAR
jgi:uncharacterized protein YecE (DUF72 family)